MLYLTEGDYINAGLSALSIIPGADAFTKTGKASKVLGNGIVESGLKHLDNVADGIKKLVKKADDAIDLEKHLPKKLLKEEAEAFAKKADKVADDVVEDAAKAIKSGSKADVLAQNRANGRAFEQQEFAKFSSQNNNAVEQITVKTSSGVRTRVDAIGLDANGNVVINEYKSSINAPLTNNQTRAFPEIFESGGVVVGKGKGIFTGGYQIPAGTEVTIVRPN